MGRPKAESNKDLPPRMTKPQRTKLARLGGAKWVRARIDKARE